MQAKEINCLRVSQVYRAQLLAAPLLNKVHRFLFLMLEEHFALPPLESQYCVGKFAADFELCCREATPPYPVTIAVQIRGHPPLSAPYASSLQLSQVVANAQQSQQQQQQPHQSQQQAPHSGTYPATPATPSLAGGNPPDDQLSSIGKKTSRARIPSVAGQSATALGMNVNDYDGRSFILPSTSLQSSFSNNLHES